ncbi:MAG TPA: hypothetical protein ENI87_13420 [bacterium]|nr:hypothetical protein [bacterium]
MTFVLMLAALCAPVAAQSLQLASGKVLIAKVEEADGDGLRVRRLDNGGLLDLRWDHLTTACANTLKRKFDLIGEDQDEIMVRAYEVAYLNNGTRQTVIGRIVDAKGDPLVVEAKGVPFRIPRKDLLPPARAVDVPASQIYTKDEFYREAAARHAPGDNANKHMLLAEELIKFRDYERAAEHLRTAEELGNAKNPQRLAVLKDRLERFKAAAEELAVLEQIQASRSRGKLRDFQKGRKLIAQFEREFPDTKLKAEFERERQRFEQARDRYLTQKVAEQWRRAITTVAQKKVLEKGFTYEAARDYAENAMTDDIVARLQKTLELEPDEIRSMWDNREKYPMGKRTEHFSYGVGSWVLGEKEILKDTARGKANQKQTGKQQPKGNDRNIERFAKLLRQAMERRRQAAQGAGQEKTLTEQGWWEQASRQEKIGWLRAYYAEYGGQLKVKFASVQPCISCYGEGTTPEIDGNGKMVRSKCFLCQGTKFVRSFKAY